VNSTSEVELNFTFFNVSIFISQGNSLKDANETIDADIITNGSYTIPLADLTYIIIVPNYTEGCWANFTYRLN